MFLLFLILFFCNFHLAEHGDWLIMVQIYERPCGVLQTRGRTQLCCLPRDAISNAQCLKHGVNFEQILPKRAQWLQKRSQVKWMQRNSSGKSKNVHRARRGHVLLSGNYFSLQKRSLFEAKSLHFLHIMIVVFHA